MIYLSACASAEQLTAQIQQGIGLMLTPDAGVRIDTASQVPQWAADNGCFTQGDHFNLAAFYAWLDAMTPARGNCLFAVAPDRVGDAAATRIRSLPVLAQLRARGWPAAYVAQDGETVQTTPWGAFDALFIGGIDCPVCKRRKELPGMPELPGCSCFKWYAARPLIQEARRRGLWVHIGRVNSGKNLLRAARMRADSADGSYMRFNPSEAIDRMGRWLRRANAPQLPLFPEAVP